MTETFKAKMLLLGFKSAFTEFDGVWIGEPHMTVHLYASHVTYVSKTVEKSSHYTEKEINEKQA